MDKQLNHLEQVMNLNSAATQALAPPVPTWSEIVQAVAAFKAQAKAKTLCAEPDCCQFGQSRGGCPCAEDEDALIAADIFNAADKAEKAHRRHAFKALQLQVNDKTAEFAGYVS